MATSGKNDILAHLKSLLSREEESQHHKPLTDFFPAIIYVYDTEKGKLKYINERRLCDDLGFSAEDVKSWNNDFIHMIFKDDVDLVKQELDRYNTLEDNHDHSYTCRLNHKEGDWRYYRTRGTVLRRKDDGKPASLIFVAEDITDKTRSELEIEALAHLVDDTEELLEFGSWSWDARIDKLYWTDGMYKLMGYSKIDLEPVVSAAFFMKHLTPRHAAGLLRAIVRAVKNKTAFEYTCTVMRGSKEEKIMYTKGKAVLQRDGELSRIIGITRDVTMQTKINGDLVHYKEMILEKEEFLNQGSWETDLRTGQTTWSKGMYQLFGYNTEKEMKQVEITNELHFMHMSEAEIVKSKEDWKSTIDNKDAYTREATIITRDGTTRRVETYGKVVRDSRGIAEKVIGTTRDVTRMREYERSLEEKIQELNRSNTELEEFAYVASHDLQEPLRKLTTFSERLQSKYAASLGKEGILYLERIVAATGNMRILIENLLEFSRTARSDKHFSVINLMKLLEEVKADLELQIEESGTVILASGLPTIEVIPSQTKQLFSNLLGNSIKFKKKDQESVITIKSEKLSASEKSQFYLKSDRNYYKIVISDNGIGFEKEYAERIFQIFQRLHGKSEYPGSGIGLAICKKIVENHGGIIFAIGIPEEGATFTVILPETQS